jgi:hypothetical protein
MTYAVRRFHLWLDRHIAARVAFVVLILAVLIPTTLHAPRPWSAIAWVAWTFLLVSRLCHVSVPERRPR